MSAKKKKTINITSIIDDYCSLLKKEMQFRWNNWSKDLSKKELYDVVGAILSRQVSLSIGLAENINMWNGNLAPIILRSMADNHINLEWILNDIDNRPREFILHGLGQLKLEIEHRKNQMEKDGEDIKADKYLEYMEAFLNSQKYSFLTEVNLGSWSGISTRKMAEECGSIDFYNYVFQPFSSCVHSTWGHISRYNSEMSINPLHKFLFKPIMLQYEPDIHYLELAARYVDKSFNSYDRKFKLKEKTESSYNFLIKELDKLIDDSN
ncbi:MAG: hypothetical protein CMD31_02990 [Flavobacteriales bacterium]|nr:hypothetical protein [Flavobacteriales bacterium]|tara:strand:+ start:37977 stop:38774 length:798 start_codon:yes stop_codon:yes gene_type:complete